MHTHTYIHTHIHSNTHTQMQTVVHRPLYQLQSLSHLLNFLLLKPVLVQGLILTPKLTDGLTWVGGGGRGYTFRV